jgi:hypothetical protein
LRGYIAMCEFSTNLDGVSPKFIAALVALHLCST